MLCCFSSTSGGVVPDPDPPGTYTTTFPTDQNPLSYDGAWLGGKTHGRDWNNLRALNGHGIGIDGPVRYADPIGCLAGNWSDDQTVEVVAYRQFMGVQNSRQEIELHLRMQLAIGSCRTYEIIWRAYDTPIIAGNFGAMPNLSLVRWRGTLATDISHFKIFSNNHESQYAVRDGDVLRGTVDGQNPVRIRTWKNGTLMRTWTDSDATRILSGSPGLGFNFNLGAKYTEFGVHSFTARNGL